jgi:nickel superoxide dismutase
MARSFISGSICLALITLAVGPASTALAHCEIPCGIYGDAARFDLIEEHCTTIEKSMTRIAEFDGGAEQHYNQAVRWVNNKEEHANKIQYIVSQYFLTQRIKPTQDDYEKRVTTLHQMLVAAMKCKQTTDVEHVAKLRELLAQFRTLYFGPEEATHLKEHQGSHAK